MMGLPTNGRLTGKVALVTGAAAENGIGFAIAATLAREEAPVVLTDIDGPQVARRAKQLDRPALGLRHDVADDASWAEVCAAVMDRFGRLDILVNNAGILRMGRADKIAEADWNDLLAINLGGARLGLRHVVPMMRAAGGGAIVNMCSVSGIVGTGRCGGYSAAKGGLRALSKCAAIDLAAYNIRVNSVHPGFILTDMQKGASAGLGEDEYDLTLKSVPLRRLGTATEVAECVAFLVSDAASYITGSEIIVDGGLTCSV